MADYNSHFFSDAAKGLLYLLFKGQDWENSIKPLGKVSLLFSPYFHVQCPSTANSSRLQDFLEKVDMQAYHLWKKPKVLIDIVSANLPNLIPVNFLQKFHIEVISSEKFQQRVSSFLARHPKISQAALMDSLGDLSVLLKRSLSLSQKEGFMVFFGSQKDLKLFVSIVLDKIKIEKFSIRIPTKGNLTATQLKEVSREVSGKFACHCEYFPRPSGKNEEEFFVSIVSRSEIINIDPKDLSKVMKPEEYSDEVQKALEGAISLIEKKKSEEGLAPPSRIFEEIPCTYNFEEENDNRPLTTVLVNEPTHPSLFISFLMKRHMRKNNPELLAEILREGEFEKDLPAVEIDFETRKIRSGIRLGVPLYLKEMFGVFQREETGKYIVRMKSQERELFWELRRWKKEFKRRIMDKLKREIEKEGSFVKRGVNLSLSFKGGSNSIKATFITDKRTMRARPYEFLKRKFYLATKSAYNKFRRAFMNEGGLKKTQMSFSNQSAHSGLNGQNRGGSTETKRRRISGSSMEVSGDSSSFSMALKEKSVFCESKQSFSVTSLWISENEELKSMENAKNIRVHLNENENRVDFVFLGKDEQKIEAILEKIKRKVKTELHSSSFEIRDPIIHGFLLSQKELKYKDIGSGVCFVEYQETPEPEENKEILFGVQNTRTKNSLVFFIGDKTQSQLCQFCDGEKGLVAINPYKQGPGGEIVHEFFAKKENDLGALTDSIEQMMCLEAFQTKDTSETGIFANLHLEEFSASSPEVSLVYLAGLFEKVIDQMSFSEKSVVWPFCGADWGYPYKVYFEVFFEQLQTFLKGFTGLRGKTILVQIPKNYKETKKDSEILEEFRTKLNESYFEENKLKGTAERKYDCFYVIPRDNIGIYKNIPKKYWGSRVPFPEELQEVLSKKYRRKIKKASRNSASFQQQANLTGNMGGFGVGFAPNPINLFPGPFPVPNSLSGPVDSEDSEDDDDSSPRQGNSQRMSAPGSNSKPNQGRKRQKAIKCFLDLPESSLPPNFTVFPSFLQAQNSKTKETMLDLEEDKHKKWLIGPQRTPLPKEFGKEMKKAIDMGIESFKISLYEWEIDIEKEEMNCLETGLYPFKIEFEKKKKPKEDQKGKEEGKEFSLMDFSKSQKGEEVLGKLFISSMTSPNEPFLLFSQIKEQSEKEATIYVSEDQTSPAMQEALLKKSSFLGLKIVKTENDMFYAEGVPKSIERLKSFLKESIKQSGVLSEMEFALPKEWVGSHNGLKLFKIDPGSPEWSRIVKNMSESFKANVKSITRIENIQMYRKYMIETQPIREKFQKNKKLREIYNRGPELFLWHGTRMTDPKSIYEKSGFDLQFASDSGSYGRALYFAADASYSCSGYQFGTPHGTNLVFFARVCVGESVAVPGGQFRKPPFKDRELNERYDSVRNSSDNLSSLCFLKKK